MMKKVTILKLFSFLFLITLISCTASKKSGTPATQPVTEQDYSGGKIQKITFTSTGRGYRKAILLTQDSVCVSIKSISIADPAVKQKMAEKEWNEVTGSLSGLDFTEIPQLKRPTMNSAADAARSSEITITTTDGKQYSHAFDDTNPNEKLKKLMDVILQVEKSH